MQKRFRQLFGAAALSAFASAAVAQSTIIDFDSPSLTGAYFPGESFTQAGFEFTQGYDPGTVDSASALGAAAPTNNRTQFYFNSNDGDLLLTHLGGRGFSLDGFSAAYVPLIGSNAPGQTIGIVALATTLRGNVFGTYFSLGDTTSTTRGSPFLTFSSALDFGRFSGLESVDFFACAIVNGSACTVATRNNAQFALDDIHLTAAVAPVPEPETVALLALGLSVLALSRRRRSR